MAKKKAKTKKSTKKATKKTTAKKSASKKSPGKKASNKKTSPKKSANMSGVAQAINMLDGKLNKILEVVNRINASINGTPVETTKPAPTLNSQNYQGEGVVDSFPEDAQQELFPTENADNLGDVTPEKCATQLQELAAVKGYDTAKNLIAKFKAKKVSDLNPNDLPKVYKIATEMLSQNTNSSQASVDWL